MQSHLKTEAKGEQVCPLTRLCPLTLTPQGQEGEAEVSCGRERQTDRQTEAPCPLHSESIPLHTGAGVRACNLMSTRLFIKDELLDETCIFYFLNRASICS